MPNATPESIRKIKVNGTSLAYRELGEGTPVVFVHGGISDLRIWEVQQEAVGREHRAIAYSCRHCWPNEPAPRDAEPSMAQEVDDLQGLVQALDAAPTHLVGNSSGGLLCLYLALRSPERVRSLVLLEPFVLPLFASVPPKPRELLALAFRDPRLAAAIVGFGARGLGPAQAAFRRGDLDAGLERFVRAVLGRYGVEKMTDARRAQARDNLDHFAAQLTASADFPPLDPEQVRRLGVPTLLLSGEQSPAILRLLTDRLHHLLPNAERVDIPEASHDAHVDNPSAVTDAILEFLGRQANAQRTA